MRLSDIMVYLSINNILLSYLLTNVPGIEEEKWPEFLFSYHVCAGGIVKCLGPITSEEFNFLKSNSVYGVMSYNSSFYKLECRLINSYGRNIEPSCIAVVSKIKPRKYDWYMELTLDIYGYLEKVPSIEIGLRR